MATHKSAAKRAKQTIKKNTRNKAKRSDTKTAVKAVRDAIAAKDKTKALELLLAAQSKLSKLAKSSAMNWKTAARKTSRLAAQVAGL